MPYCNPALQRIGNGGFSPPPSKYPDPLFQLRARLSIPTQKRFPPHTSAGSLLAPLSASASGRRNIWMLPPSMGDYGKPHLG